MRGAARARVYERARFDCMLIDTCVLVDCATPERAASRLACTQTHACPICEREHGGNRRMLDCVSISARSTVGLLAEVSSKDTKLAL